MEELYAVAEDIEHCRKWFAERGINLRVIRCGLSGIPTRALFEALFAAKLTPREASPGESDYNVFAEPEPPDELADYIDQISVTTPPAFC